MKFLALALLFIGAVAAAPTAAPAVNTGRELVLALEKRGDALLERVKKVLAEHRHEHGHLLATLDHQAALVEALVLDLKAQVADKDRIHHIHHIHVIEEDLLFLENRVSEEIAALHHAKDPKNPPKGLTLEQIVAQAEKLVKEGKDAIAKHPKAKEVGDIEREIIVIQALVSAVKAKPAPADLKKEEQELIRQEKSLQQLIEKANARKN